MVSWFLCLLTFFECMVIQDIYETPVVDEKLLDILVYNVQGDDKGVVAEVVA